MFRCLGILNTPPCFQFWACQPTSTKSVCLCVGVLCAATRGRGTVGVPSGQVRSMVYYGLCAPPWKGVIHTPSVERAPCWGPGGPVVGHKAAASSQAGVKGPRVCVRGVVNRTSRCPPAQSRPQSRSTPRRCVATGWWLRRFPPALAWPAAPAAPAPSSAGCLQGKNE